MNEIYRTTRVLLLSLLFSSLLVVVKAQEDSLSISKTTLSIQAYLDVFYSYDFNEPETDYRLPYIVNHNRHNEFNLNLGSIGVAVENDSYHANLVLQTGTYAKDNYANEDAIMSSINEASAGIALTKNRKLWLDAGILSSHIGYESPFQINDLTLTRSIMAEGAPYFFAGAKLTYTFNERWMFMAMITNGWQRIRRVEGNSMMSYGTQLQFKPSKNMQINWNTFIGTEDPDDKRRMRYFNEIYALFSLGEKWDLQAGFDLGMQQESKGSDTYNNWYLASIIARYSFVSNWAVSLRGEYINDVKKVVIANPTPNDFVCYGISANLDYSPIQNVIARVEGRYLYGENNIFIYNDLYVNNDFFITFSLSIAFGKKLDI